jgi:hypothetical protein
MRHAINVRAQYDYCYNASLNLENSPNRAAWRLLPVVTQKILVWRHQGVSKAGSKYSAWFCDHCHVRAVSVKGCSINPRERLRRFQASWRREVTPWRSFR